MTTPMTISQILEAASQLSTEQQFALNKGLCAMVRPRRTIAQIASGSAFVPGMIVRFDAKRKGIKMIRINKFNRAGTAVVGYEVDSKGDRLPMAPRWTVATTLCVKVA